MRSLKTNCFKNVRVQHFEEIKGSNNIEHALSSAAVSLRSAQWCWAEELAERFCICMMGGGGQPHHSFYRK